MTKLALRLAIALLFAVLVGSAAHAAVYTVTLKNGTTFETRYKPVSADWDASIAMLMTDKGNWIALPADEIADVASNVEISGYGYHLDKNTIVLGTSPNDLVADDGEEGGTPGATGAGAAAGQEEPPPPPDYTVDQFVNAPLVGASGGGIPVSYAR
ncbi:MAG: hypothetical protein HC897_03650 [Thermoanaerobaculia bacterium]|nr:hypothetical protein [Thermoanaerobaculia bacterium]